MSKVRFQVFVVALILYVTIVNYLNRIALSYAILPVEGDLGLSDAQFGFVASGFTIGYFLMTLPAGILVDKFGSIRIWTIAAAFWSIVTICISYVMDYYFLFGFLVLLGMAEGSHFPALIKTIGDWFAPRWRSRALALGLLGVPLASVIGGPLLTSIIQIFGWRWMFFDLGVLGLVWTFVWPLSFWGKKNPHLGTSAVHFRAGESVPWRALFTSPCFLSGCAVYFTFGYLLFFGLVWLPGYLQKSHGLSLKDTGFFVVLPWFVSGVGLLVGGGISDYLFKRTCSIRISRSYPIIVALLGASLCFYLLTITGNLMLDLWLLSFGLGFTFILNAPIYALNVDLFPKNAATAQGIITCFSSIGGTISSSLTGHLVEMTGNFQMALLIASVLALLAALIAIFFQKSPKML
jgi:ACS family hexuronate transporter-like MFS transporter